MDERHQRVLLGSEDLTRETVRMTAPKTTSSANPDLKASNSIPFDAFPWEHRGNTTPNWRLVTLIEFWVYLIGVGYPMHTPLGTYWVALGT